MFISHNKAKQLVQDAVAGNLTKSQVPDWLSPIFNALEKQQSQNIAQSSLGVDISKNITHFGRDALDFNEQILSLVDHSQVLASSTEEMAATASEIEKLGHDVLTQVEKTRDQSTLSKDLLDQLIDKFESIEQSVSQVGEQVSQFVSKAQNIIQLTSTVNEILANSSKRILSKMDCANICFCSPVRPERIFADTCTNGFFSFPTW